jgi:pSer/pThr/pTyr-binding forkhead associated (FHA) protein
MLDIRLKYSTDDGPQEVEIMSGRTTFGRGSDVDHRIADDGLSRLHATVYYEDERVWITDENSTNGTFVNGVPVSSTGTPLSNGDIVRIGNHTNMQVSISERQEAVAAAPVSAYSYAPAAVSTSSTPASSPIHILPIILISGAIFIIAVTTVVVGFTVFGSNRSEVVQVSDRDPDDEESPEQKPSPAGKTTSQTPDVTPTANDNSVLIPGNAGNMTPQQNLPPGKKYLEMTDSERRQYIEVKAMKVAQIIGNNSSEKIPSGAIDKIKGFVEGYVSRLKSKRTDGCASRAPWADGLQVTYERASKNAPFIIKAFNEKGIDSRIGLYLAMIESEHCVCLQSGTGPLGMFQFTYATAKLHFVPSEGVIKGASPSNPDVRCQPEPAARAAASYMKALTGRYGTGPSSVPLAIGSYNSGEGGLSQNLEKALSSGQGLERDFWTLIERGDILSKQFQAENFKYVPKFFAAAIIGENPQDFGLNLQPLSTYSK